MGRNSIIALFLLYRRRKRIRNGLHWVHPIIQKREEFGAFRHYLVNYGMGQTSFLKLFLNVLSFNGTEKTDSTIFKRSTLYALIQTNMLELPSERPL